MKIILAEHFGICFGVRDAIAQAEALARKGPLTILGQLVHNPVVHQQMLASGVQEGSLDHLEADSRTVLITAHGASPRRKNAWTDAGFDVQDSTCPLVHHAHQQLRRLTDAGYHPVVIGKKGHVEVRGLTEDFPGSSVVSEVADVGSLPRSERYGVISQTTQPVDHAHAMVAEIRRRHPSAEVRFVDTVCKPTKDRQAALHKLIRAAEVIVIVGGRESNNTRQLVLTCHAAGRRAIHVERPEELRASDFHGAGVVGLTAGTSTLGETVAAVRAKTRRDFRGAAKAAMITRLKVLLRADADEMSARLHVADRGALLFYVLIVCVGAGLYGVTVGIWRAPLQSFYTAVKFPLLIFLTCGGNALLNGMLAQVLGSGLSFRQTSVAILMSFAIAALILGGFAPITLFVWFNAPALGSGRAVFGHSIMLLTDVVAIAAAGVIANRRLFNLLRKVSGSESTARTVFCSWLTGNLFLGAQLAWNLRPFIGSPNLPVEFLRPDPLRGNFYEAVWRAFLHLLH